jgi:hypothetical protein
MLNGCFLEMAVALSHVLETNVPGKYLCLRINYKDNDMIDQHFKRVAIMHISEVESCYALEKLIIYIENEHGGDNGYKPYLVRGTDTATGQNVGLLTRVDPIQDLERTEERVMYPIAGSKCGYSDPEPDPRQMYGVSKHYITRFQVNGMSILVVGLHLLAFPQKPDRCEKVLHYLAY